MGNSLVQIGITSMKMEAALTNTIAYEMKTDSGKTYLVDYPDSNNMTQRIYSFDKEGRMRNKAGWQKLEDTYCDENGNQTYTQWVLSECRWNSL